MTAPTLESFHFYSSHGSLVSSASPHHYPYPNISRQITPKEDLPYSKGDCSLTEDAPLSGNTLRTILYNCFNQK